MIINKMPTAIFDQRLQFPTRQKISAGHDENSIISRTKKLFL